MKISVNVTALNEENIERCLKSASFADEIVVTIDSRTTDNTAKLRVSILQSLCPEFRGFSDIKQFCLSKSKMNGFLFLTRMRNIPALRARRGCNKNGDYDGYKIKRNFFLAALLNTAAGAMIISSGCLKMPALMTAGPYMKA